MRNRMVPLMLLALTLNNLTQLSFSQQVTSTPQVDINQPSGASTKKESLSDSDKLSEKELAIQYIFSLYGQGYFKSLINYKPLIQWTYNTLDEAISINPPADNLDKLALRDYYIKTLTMPFRNKSSEIILFPNELKSKLTDYQGTLTEMVSTVATDYIARNGLGSNYHGYYPVLVKHLKDDYLNNPNLPEEDLTKAMISCSNDCTQHPFYSQFDLIIANLAASERDTIERISSDDDLAIMKAATAAVKNYLGNNEKYHIVSNNKEMYQNAYQSLHNEVIKLGVSVKGNRLEIISGRIDNNTYQIAETAVKKAYSDSLAQLNTIIQDGINTALPVQTYPVLSEEFRQKIAHYYKYQFSINFKTSDLWDNWQNLYNFNNKIVDNIQNAYEQQHLNYILAAANIIIHNDPTSKRTRIDYRDKELETQLLQDTALCLNYIILNEKKEMITDLDPVIPNSKSELEIRDKKQEISNFQDSIAHPIDSRSQNKKRESSNDNIENIEESAHSILKKKKDLELFSVEGYYEIAKAYGLPEIQHKKRKRILGVEHVITGAELIIGTASDIFLPAIGRFWDDKIREAGDNATKSLMYQGLKTKALSAFTKENIKKVLTQQNESIKNLVQEGNYLQKKQIALPDVQMLIGEII